MSDIYLSLTETPSVVTLAQPVIASSVAATVTVGNTVTVALDANSLSALENVTVTVGAAVSVSNFPSTQTIAGTVTANVFGKDPQGSNLYQIPVIAYDEGVEPNGLVVPVQITNGGGTLNSSNPLPISGTVTIGSALPAGTNRIGVVTIGAGTVTIGAGTAQIGSVTASISGIPTVALVSIPSLVAGTAQIGSVTASISNSVTIGSLPAISGTVTVGNSITIGSFATSVTARLINPAGTAVTYAEVGTAGSPSIDVLSVQGVSGGTSLPISGTAGSLTTRFGSITTAGTAQISSAVTNASRKYLLIQNVTTSSNVITVGIGFTPTTTQGIQLSAGAGITFESSCIPTGAVQILSSVTASNFTILEA